MSHPSSHVPTEQSRKETCDTQEISQDRRGQQQQELEDKIKGEAHTKSTGSTKLLSSTFIPSAESNVKYPFEAFTQALSTLFEWSNGESRAALGKLFHFASSCAVLSLPTAAAAYELKKGNVGTGYETIPAVTILLMAAVFFLRVHDSVRGTLKNFWHMLGLVATLLAMAMILVPAINDVNQLTAVDPITKV